MLLSFLEPLGHENLLPAHVPSRVLAIRYVWSPLTPDLLSQSSTPALHHLEPTCSYPYLAQFFLPGLLVT